MEEFAEDGLRTLCIAGKELKEDKWDSWFWSEIHGVTLLMDGRVEKMNELYKELEQGLELNGCTGVEDKLQGNEVPPDPLLNNFEPKPPNVRRHLRTSGHPIH
uniref:Uncharacterized protein n=1 Tax=Chromera velia CCMP2878 TaxID=1169474 RepID=A0A0G4HMG6_9ALVE|eukprot:Cvel_7490.t1-p1 / transcript=Cvel_7490.t1 / gene=Cvel_7490 / organism=Chromera_velia_CCMP2878 / gene_product=Probable phospholipid-transporting ATPase IA, putative / transcript_product=Probable phospholipid-transporting ATPase IA, putative / location=Cvel_scaffold392:81721-84689(-) / protein_length=102 / sequence_SO=supercontig / SO=protein_coding / is_pseudo=false